MQVPVTARSGLSYDSQLVRVFTTTVQTLPVAVVVACAAALAWREHGSIDAGSWLPYSIALALVAATVLFTGVAAKPSRVAAIGIAGLGSLGVWAAFSLLWAPSPSLARDEGLLTLTYALALGIAVLTLWTEDRRLGALGAVAAAAGGIAVAAAATLVWGDGQLAHYSGGRLAFPISYVNATGALFAVGFWPATVLASRREGNVLVRALALGVSAATLGACLMTQSKGSALGLIVATAVVLAVSPLRLRLVPPLALTGLLAALAFGRLTEPFRIYGDEAIRRAGAAALILATVAVLVGLAYALVDAHVRVGRRTARQFGFLVLGALVTGLAVGIAAFLVKVPAPGTWLSDKWRAAHHYTSKDDGGSTHLLQLGSNRFDFWRVAIDEFQRHPIAGDGARGFGPAYLIHGASSETPRRAHSLPLEVLSEQGIVGFLLLAAGIGAPLLVGVRRALRGNAVAAAALGGFIAWLVSAAVDWTWTLPAATIPALVLLGIGAAAQDGEGPVASRLAKVTAAVAVVVALAAFAPPWLSSRFIERGIAERSQTELDRARFFDPLSTAPLLAETWVKPLNAALPDLQAAARREPRMASTRYTLGLAWLAAGNKPAARVELAAALRLKPGDRLIESALQRAR
jgi:hypothetical protein